MNVLLAAVASDLVGRLVSFLIGKYHESSGATDMVTLQRALLRARAVVEEAEGRQITNRAMLLQLSQLRAEMCRASYLLDTSKGRAAHLRRSRATARRSRSSIGSPPGSDDVVEGGRLAVVESLEAALSDMKEFVVLLGACPRLNRQPYSSYLFMEGCMFGRQMEKEQLIGFLLQPAQDLDVLPIIGPHEIGKRTLVEHVCLEERVREHFAKIHRIRGDDLDLQIHEHHQGSIDTAQRSLIVIDFADGDTDEEERWRRFRSSLRRRAHRESKVIIISRTEKHSGLGTVPPVRLRTLRREELWYLFKALAFGGADPEERPELVGIAMSLFATIDPDLAPLAAASKLAASLRADLSARSWSRVLEVSVGVILLRLGAEAVPGVRELPENTGYYFPFVRVKDAPNAPCVFYGRRKLTSPVRSKLPRVTTMLDLVESVFPGGEKRFEVLLWQSRIPPYASYVATCDMEEAQRLAVGRKRLLNKRRRGQQ